MLLTISTTYRPAIDLGFLLAKNPGRTQTFDLTFGKAHVFYPVAAEELCSVALLLDLDPLELVKRARRTRKDDGPLTRYVNDRPYVASSFMSVAIAQVFRTALGGKSRERAQLAETAIPSKLLFRRFPVEGERACCAVCLSRSDMTWRHREQRSIHRSQNGARAPTGEYGFGTRVGCAIFSLTCMC